jgi:site-specific DNA recombinase
MSLSETAVIYARVSKGTSEDESVSITTQLQGLRSLAAAKGLTVVKEYVDDGISGFKNVHRPAFSSLVADMSKQQFSTILVRHFDRLARNDEDSSLIRVGCARYGIKWMTQSGEVTDPAAAQGGLLASITGAVALYESKVKSERLRARYAHNRSRGVSNTGRRAFGYSVDKQTPHPTEALELQKAFAHILDGGSIFQILKDWNTRGLPTIGKSKCWSYPAIRTILTNPRYAALLTYQGQIIEDTPGDWTPLVSRQDFDDVQAILNDPKRRTSPGSKTRYLGGGIYTCQVCGSPMRTNTSSDRQTGERHVYYRCSTKLAYDGDKTKHVTVKMTLADELVRSAVVAAFAFGTADLFPAQASSSRSLSTLQAAASRVRETKGKVLRLMTQELVSEEEATSQLQELKRQELDLERDIQAAIQAEMQSDLTVDLRAGMWTGGLQKVADVKRELGERFDALSVDKRRELVRTLLDVVVNGGRGEKVTITHRVVTSLNRAE